jgi:2-polyprenyl-3-methyl-5-hydroxy-6-metoxy-1,4-benzoquinol methylase
MTFNTVVRQSGAPANEMFIRCNVCGGAAVEQFFTMSAVPVQCNVLRSTREDALAARKGDLLLGFCPDCGHVFNTAFDPDIMEYDQQYENSLHFSEQFQRYLLALITALDDRLNLHGKHVIDVGCGKGEFLNALCQQTGAFGTGFDRSYVPAPDDSAMATNGPEFVVDFYSEAYAEYPVDVLTCRHVLEHIDKPVDFLQMLRRAIGDRTGVSVFFEVPNALYTISRLGIWDIIYEHVSYFTPMSLKKALECGGFSKVQITEAFGGQYLLASAVSSSSHTSESAPHREDLRQLFEDVDLFRDRYESKVRDWKTTLSVIRRNALRTVIWGTGSKGVTFLNALRVGSEVPYAVDINTRKTGLYVPGTGQEVVLPEALREYEPELVTLMNPIYEGEVMSTLRSLELDAELIRA